MRAAFCVAVVRFEAGHLVAPRGGFLRFASSVAGFGRVRSLYPNLMRPGGRGPGAWTAPARCPHGSGFNPSPPPFPGKGASRRLPSAVPGHQLPGTALGERRWARLRVKAKPSRAADGRPGPECCASACQVLIACD